MKNSKIELYTLLDTLSGSEKVQNVRRKKGLYRAERVLLGIIFLVLFIFGVPPLEAQPPFYLQNRPMLRSDGQDPYSQSSPLGFTEYQIKALENLQHAFIAEATPLRSELISLRFELRHLIRDQNVPSKTLLERQRKISELQGKLESLSLSYQIKARSIFTKEQLEQFPQDCSLGIEPGFGMGISESRGLRKGLR